MSSGRAQTRSLPAITSRTEAARADFPGTVSAQTDEFWKAAGRRVDFGSSCARGLTGEAAGY